MSRRKAYRFAVQALGAVVLLAWAAVAVQAQGGDQLPPTAFQKFVKDLKLTPDQQEKIKPILADEMKQLRAAYMDPSLTDRQAVSKMAQIRQAGRSKITPILNPEQNKKVDAALEKVRQEMIARIKAQKAAGQKAAP